MKGNIRGVITITKATAADFALIALKVRGKSYKMFVQPYKLGMVKV